MNCLIICTVYIGGNWDQATKPSGKLASLFYFLAIESVSTHWRMLPHTPNVWYFHHNDEQRSNHLVSREVNGMFIMFAHSTCLFVILFICFFPCLTWSHICFTRNEQTTIFVWRPGSIQWGQMGGRWIWHGRSYIFVCMAISIFNRIYINKMKWSGVAHHSTKYFSVGYLLTFSKRYPQSHSMLIVYKPKHT